MNSIVPVPPMPPIPPEVRMAVRLLPRTKEEAFREKVQELALAELRQAIARIPKPEKALVTREDYDAWVENLKGAWMEEFTDRALETLKSKCSFRDLLCVAAILIESGPEGLTDWMKEAIMRPCLELVPEVVAIACSGGGPATG